MRVASLFGHGRPVFSFEFFPPKEAAGEQKLLEALTVLAELGPGFVSITYGAGGSNRSQVVSLAQRIKGEAGIEPVVHLTCVGHDRDELRRILDGYVAAGIENVLCLRGDPPRGVERFEPVPGGFRYASELVHFVRAEGYPFCIGAAAYPEGHPECADRGADLRNLKAKVDEGVEFLITQLFLDDAFFFDFVERARHAGIRVPIVPGLMPITGFDQIQRFTRLCGATVPMRLQLELERRREDPRAISELGVAHATLQAIDLLERGAEGIHFYTLNRSQAAQSIFAAMHGRFERPARS